MESSMAVELKLDVLINRYLLGNLALVTMEPTYCKNWSCELHVLYYIIMASDFRVKQGGAATAVVRPIILKSQI